MTRRPRVVVVDDSAFARSVLSRVLSATRAIDVVGTASNGTDALARIEQHDPDVITLDLTMPELDGLGVLRAVQGRA
ncbi:MAG: response regulator, partial [Kofleriaceae bacterium]